MNENTLQSKKNIFDILGLIEKGFCIISIFFIVLITSGEVIARIFNTPRLIPAALLTHFLLLLGLFAGMYTSKSKEHISIALFQYIHNEKAKEILALITGVFSVFICTVLAWASVSFIKIAMQPRLILFIPNVVFVAAMPLAFGVMALRFGLHLPKRKFLLLPLAVIIGTAVSFPAICKLIWGFDVPEIVYDYLYYSQTVLFYARLPLILISIALALMGAPVFTVIAAISLIIIQSAGGEAEVVSNSIYTALTDTSIIVIPLFTLTGFILSESRAGHRLVSSFRSLFSWIPGGLIIATVIICAFFTSFTGASGVTILALGGILYTILSEKSAYPQKFSIGLLTSAGCIGLLFPPSLPIILVGSTTRTNIIHMFMGSLIPGLILVIAMIIIGVVISIKIKIPVEPFDIKKVGASLKGSILEILLPIFLIIGYFSGAFSLIEIGAISVIYVFIAEVVIHREIKIKDLPKVFYKALPIIGGILCIIASAKALSYAIVDTQAPENFAAWMKATIESKFLFLLLLNIALLALGCVMDIFSAILVVLPLIAPLGAVYGIDPVHLGVIFIINMEVGFLTPPVGINLFLSSYRFGKPFTEICRYVVPFLLVQLAVVFIVTYFPVLSTFLPRFF